MAASGQQFLSLKLDERERERARFYLDIHLLPRISGAETLRIIL